LNKRFSVYVTQLYGPLKKRIYGKYLGVNRGHQMFTSIPECLWDKTDKDRVKLIKAWSSTGSFVFDPIEVKDASTGTTSSRPNSLLSKLLKMQSNT
jgi:hypothetical protein